MSAYYNEFDPFAAEWLRGLIKDGRIADGDVDERSITEVRAADLEGYTQCHFFAGIGGWSYALRLAGWPDDRAVWTGSCPCQPFSAAGKREGNDDERHLWPDFFRLIRECRPEAVFGEQVASSDVVGTQLEADFIVAIQRGDYAKANKLAKRLVATQSFHSHPRWVDGISADLASADYATRWRVLGAHSVGAPHIRQRLYWVAYAGSVPGFASRICRVEGGTGVWRDQSANGSDAGVLADTAGSRHAGAGQGAGDDRDGADQVPQRGFTFDESSWSRPTGILVDSVQQGLEGHARDAGFGGQPGRHGENSLRPAPAAGAHSCAVADDDGQRFSRWQEQAGIEERPDVEASRRADAGGCGIAVIACRDGKHRRIPAEPALFPVAHGLPGRVGLLRGAGNAIVPQLAAEFIQACEESRSEVGAV